MRNKKNPFILLLFLALCGSMAAQTSGSNSPYSRYGWGNMADEAQGFNKGMGGLALGMRSSSIINHQNPAAYSAIDSLTFLFDIGVSLQNCRMKYAGSSVNAQNTTLDYATAAFRLTKGLGISIGMRPYTNIGYDFTSSRLMEDIDGYGEKTTTSTYLGEGGFHTAYLGLGWSPLKNISIGANVGYIWGDYSHSSFVTFSESTIQSLARYYTATINTYTLDFGLQYTKALNKKNSLTIGATAGIGHKINEEATFINQKLSSSSVVGADTIHANNAFELPFSFGAGFAWTHNKRLTVGLDYTCQLWKNARFPELMTENNALVYRVGKSSFTNRHKFVAGLQYTPDPDGIRVRDHIAYRMGFSYATPYYKMDGENGPKNMCISAGVGLPIMNIYGTRSVVNVTAQWEHVSPKSGGFISENYLRLCLGLTFNANWFNKWKFE